MDKAPNVADQDSDEQENLDEVEEESTNEEDTSTDEETSDTDQEEQEEAPTERPVKYMPLEKFNEKNAKWKAEKAEYEAKISELSKRQDSDVSDDIKKLAEEYGTEPEFVKKVIALASKQNQIPKELLSNLQATQEETLFNKEFEGVIKEHPELNTPEGKANLKELAYTENLHKTPLSVIAKSYLYDSNANPGKNTAESSSGGTKTSKQVVDFDAVTPEDISGMDNKTFNKYSEYMAQQERDAQ